MIDRRYRIGFVGLQPGRSWAARAHIPALKSLSRHFEIAGVANTSRASAELAAAACGIPRAFESVAELVNSPLIDIVVVTVKVPHHLDIALQAIDAGKHIYCEWPLGNGLAEAEHMTELVRKKGLLGVVGNQARVAPPILYLRQVLSEGIIGDILSTTITARGKSWGGFLDSEATRAYLLDLSNGATMVTIPFGHTLAAIRDVLGDISEVSAIIANRRHQVPALDTGNILPMTAPDQLLVSGLLSTGAPISVHYRGGDDHAGEGFVWEINGTRGDIRVLARDGGTQMVRMSLTIAKSDDRRYQPLEVPEVYEAGYPAEVIPGNVARIYARMATDLDKGTRSAPTFEDAVELHRVIHTIEEAARSGNRLKVSAPNRAIPRLL